MERRSIILVLSLLIVNVEDVFGQVWSISDIIPANYNPKIAPNSNGVTNVNISVTINSLVAVTETTSSFQLDMTFKQRWIDNRLSLNPLITKLLANTTNDITNLLLDSSFVSKFWTPDIYFQNALSASVVNVGLPIQYLAIGANNNITLITRVSGTFICKMDLSLYPQDYQFCSLEAVSHPPLPPHPGTADLALGLLRTYSLAPASYDIVFSECLLIDPTNSQPTVTQTASQMQIFWEEFVSSVKENSKFRIRNLYQGTCFRTSYLGDFSCQTGTLKLVRRVSYYVIRAYAPTFLQVVVSFVSFWIPIVGYPARVTITITPLLALITTDIGLKNDIGVEYVVAINWWMIWCQVFVFLALCEYALAISWAHFTNEKKAFKAGPFLDQNGNQMVIVEGHYFGNDGWFKRSGRVIDKILYFFFGNVDYTKDPIFRNKVDYCARIVFPIIWIIYVLIYIFATICPWAARYN